MHQFHILLHSFREMEQFVSIAMVQPFEVRVGNERTQINGKNYIGMFTLDFKDPLLVQMVCSEDEYLRFRQDAAAFVI